MINISIMLILCMATFIISIIAVVIINCTTDVGVETIRNIVIVIFVVTITWFFAATITYYSLSDNISKENLFSIIELESDTTSSNDKIIDTIHLALDKVHTHPIEDIDITIKDDEYEYGKLYNVTVNYKELLLKEKMFKNHKINFTITSKEKNDNSVEVFENKH